MSIVDEFPWLNTGSMMRLESSMVFRRIEVPVHCKNDSCYEQFHRRNTPDTCLIVNLVLARITVIAWKKRMVQK